MKAIMISIQPKWVEKILNGEKTIEIRKTMPSCELPVMVYIYETKSKYLRKYHNNITNKDGFVEYEGKGKVVAYFTLNKVEQYGFMYSPLMFINSYFKVENDKLTNEELDYDKCCISKKKLMEYANDGKLVPKPLYTWHIDDLQIYDTPRELSEFKHWVHDEDYDGWNEKRTKIEKGYVLKSLTRPFQSWGYVD